MNKRQLQQLKKYTGVNLPKEILSRLSKPKIERYEHLKIAAKASVFMYLIPIVGILLLIPSIAYNYQFAQALKFQGIAGYAAPVTFVAMDIVRYYSTNTLGAMVLSREQVNKVILMSQLFVVLLFGSVAIYAFVTVQTDNAKSIDRSAADFERDLAAYNARKASLEAAIKEARSVKPDPSAISAAEASLEAAMMRMNRILNTKYKRKIVGEQLNGCKTVDGVRTCGPCMVVNGTFTRRYCGRFLKHKTEAEAAKRKLDRFNQYKSPERLVNELNVLLSQPPRQPDSQPPLTGYKMYVMGFIIEILGMVLVFITPVAYAEIRVSRVNKGELRCFVRSVLDDYLMKNVLVTPAVQEAQTDKSKRASLFASREAFQSDGLSPEAVVVAQHLKKTGHGLIVATKVITKQQLDVLLNNRKIKGYVVDEMKSGNYDSRTSALIALLTKWGVLTKSSNGRGISAKFRTNFANI